MQLLSKPGHIPAVVEYHEAMGIMNKDGAVIDKHLNFDQIEAYLENAKEATV
jgi:aconitate hydratase 2/2-methylisocitrate dehydratase